MSSVITLLRVLPEFYEYKTGTLIWRLPYVDLVKIVVQLALIMVKIVNST